MNTTEVMPTAKSSDAELVTRSLEGSRDAFRHIVERYQTLICSVAYCGTGNVSRSEDLAQETFLTAWKQLGLLREPQKLRGWLCGIVRNRLQKSRHQVSREPSHDAAPLDDAGLLAAPDVIPSEQSCTRDEEAIMWRALERIPEIYREPLLLFYRQHQSIEQVAEALELSEDAIKQRLSRGRKMLQQEVQSFVESAMRRTAPGTAFSGAVIAALPLAAAPAVGSGLTMATKSVAAAKTSVLGVWLVTLIGAFAGFGAQWLAIRATTLDPALRARTVRRVFAGWILILGIAVGGEFAVYAMSRHFHWTERVTFCAVASFWWFYVTALATWSIVIVRRMFAPSLRTDDLRQLSRPMKPALFAAMLSGAYLSLSFWLIRLAWLAGDHLTAGVVVILMLILGSWHFSGVRRRSGTAAVSASFWHLAWAAVVILGIFNFRIEAWSALANGVNVSELRTHRPVWMVPVLTLAFFIWMAAFVRATTPKRRG